MIVSTYLAVRILDTILGSSCLRSCLSTDSLGTEELEKLYVGQSHDLYWVYNDSCPTIEDYFKMVDYSM